MARSRVRPDARRVLLCARDPGADAEASRVRRVGARHRSGDARLPRHHPGTRLVLAGVVSPVSLRTWLAEPLVHFLLAGLALFAAVSWWQGPLDAGRTIRLSREDLIVFLQGRAQVYDRESFAALLKAMPARQRRALVHDAALYEALYREGIALDLAEADPLIRQRIVQQMRQLIAEEAAEGV